MRFLFALIAVTLLGAAQAAAAPVPDWVEIAQGDVKLRAARPRSAGASDDAGDFRSAVAFYPGCSRLLNTAWAARVPTLILIGAVDDVTSPAVCQQMVTGARGRSARSLVHIYAGAYHD